MYWHNIEAKQFTNISSRQAVDSWFAVIQWQLVKFGGDLIIVLLQ